MARGEVDKRKRSGRQQRRTILIVCEGEKTEYFYFRHFAESLRGKASIKIRVDSHKDPEGLTEYASAYKTQFGLNPRSSDKIWVVFDADQNSQAQIDAAIKPARKISATLVMSNPCFELWYLLHFEERKVPLSCDEAFAKLKVHMPVYEKNLDVFDVLYDAMPAAMERAKALEQYAVNPLSLAANPCTSVWRMVGEMGDYPQ